MAAGWGWAPRAPLPGDAAGAGAVDLPGGEQVHGHRAAQRPRAPREAEAAPLRRRRHGREHRHRAARPAPPRVTWEGRGLGGVGGASPRPTPRPLAEATPI